MRRTRLPVARDTLLALLVLALLALNFGHSSAVFAAGGRVVVTATSVCGDPLAPSAGDHFACHACRPAAVALPPSPCAVEPVAFGVTPVTYIAALLPLDAAPVLITGSPRAPPFA